MKINHNTAGYGYLCAAAVLTTFDPEKIRPMGGNSTSEIGYLFANSTLTHDSNGQPLWILRHAVRRDWLTHLLESQQIQKALDANPNRPRSSLQELFEQFLLGQPPKVTDMQLEDLTQLRQVIDWLHGLMDNVPSVKDIEQQLQWARLLNPFEQLTGNHFRGRADELNLMRAYVEVLPPNRVSDLISRNVRNVFNLKERPPLMIYGPGGMGKSTLLAKFILEHVDVADALRIPFTYIDFDRPGLIAEQPITILIEAVRQLAVQYPHAREACLELSQLWQQRLDDLSFSLQQQVQTKKRIVTRSALNTSTINQSRYVTEFARLLNSEFFEEEKPYLLILDTFEEVQYRSRDFVDELWGLLEELQQQYPRLRAVIAGRAKIESFGIEPMELKTLDPDAAIGYLMARGMPDEFLAREVFERVGGNPLSLSLASRVLETEKAADGQIEDLVPSRFSLFRRIQESQIQGQLYTRILNHIHNDRVRQLAHPGLILRRITPEVIREVLAEPCGLEVKSDEEAQQLFNSLAQEVFLVQFDDDGALLHRSDIRRIMIESLKLDEPIKVPQIHRKAIAYYEKQDGIIARAEEIYHRLFIEDEFDPIAARWMDGIEPRLRPALDEVSRRFRPQLASYLGVEGYHIDWNEADQMAWERRAISRVQDLVERGRYERTIQILNERESNDYKQYRELYIFEAQSLAELNRWEEARRAVKKGIYAYRRDDGKLPIEMLLLAARIDTELGYYEQAADLLDTAQDIAGGTHDQAEWLPEIGARRLLTLAKLRTQQKDYEAAISQLHEASRLASLEGNLEDVSVDINRQFLQTYSAQSSVAAQATQATCQVKIESGNTVIMQSGVLIGPDLVLTSSIEISNNSEITFIFDHRHHPSSSQLLKEKRYQRTKTNWIVDIDENVLQHVIIRVDGRPGDDRIEPNSQIRGWVPIQPQPPSRDIGLIRLDYAYGNPLQITHAAIEGPVPPGPAIAYRKIDSPEERSPGASGGPIFNINWELVGIHQQISESRGKRPIEKIANKIQSSHQGSEIINIGTKTDLIAVRAKVKTAVSDI